MTTHHAEPDAERGPSPAKRARMDDGEAATAANDSNAIMGSRASLHLPDEILMAIFSSMPSLTGRDWTERFYEQARGTPMDWTTAPDILNIALTCRRFYRLVSPYFARSFEDWCGIKVWRHRLENDRGWSYCLRAILRQPRLGTYLEQVGINHEVYAWRKVHGNKLAGLDKWLATDFELADAAINKICDGDAWKALPGVWNNRVYKRNTPQEAAHEWREAIRDGRIDAMVAVLLALAPNLKELSVTEYTVSENGPSPGSEFNSLELSREDVGTDYLEQIFWVATCSQKAAVRDESRRHEALLPSLRRLKIRTPGVAGDIRREATDSFYLPLMTVQDAFSFLALPSLEYASLGDLTDDEESRVLPDVKLGLKELELIYRAPGNSSAGRLLEHCPNIESLSFLSYGHTSEGIWGEFHPLIPHLAECAPGLKSFTLQGANFENSDGGIEDVGLSELAAFKHLTSFETTWQELERVRSDHKDEDGGVWDIYPSSLQRLTLSDVWDDEYDDLLEEVAALAGAREKGRVPNLSTLVITNMSKEGSSYDGLGSPQSRNQEELRPLEELCKAAGITFEHRPFED